MHEDKAGTMLLAKTEGVGEISMCGCGVVSVHLGNVSLRMEASALLEVEQMIQSALARLCELAERRKVDRAAAAGSSVH